LDTEEGIDMSDIEQEILDRATEIRLTAIRYAIANRIDVVDHLAVIAAKLEYQLNTAIGEKLEAEQDRDCHADNAQYGE